MLRKTFAAALAVMLVSGVLGAQTTATTSLKDVSQEPLAAKITLPWNNSMVRASVPVFGFAGGKSFKSYRLEYGQSRDPKTWIPISSGTRAWDHDPWSSGEVKWNPDKGADGTLGDWRTGLTAYHYCDWDKTLLGEYTLRLIVEGKDGTTVEDRVHVIVAEVLVKSIEGEIQSPDGFLRLKTKPETITSNFVLVSMLPSTEPKPDPNLKMIGSAYEFQPPGLHFLKPAQLTAFYKPKDLDTDGDGKPDIAPEKLGIYYYRSVEEDWRRLPSQVIPNTPTSGAVTANMSGSTNYLAYFALMSDFTPPAPPQLDSVGPDLAGYSAAFSGRSEPESSVEVLLDGKTFAQCTAGDDGKFTTARLKIALGEHTLTAKATDGANNASAFSEAVKFTASPTPPKTVNSIRFLGDTEARQGERFLIEVTGEDTSGRVDHALVKVTSTSDPHGIELELTETGPKTGIFVGITNVDDTTSIEPPRIKAVQDKEKIVASYPVDPGKKAELCYVDKVPPSTPSIESRGYPVLVMKGFEETDEKEALQDCETVEGKFGAQLALAEDDGGNHFLKFTRQQWQSHVGAVMLSQQFDTADWPLLSFDCLIPSGLKVDLLVRLADQRVFTITLTGDKPYYPALAKAEGVKDDGQWHNVLIPLHSLLTRGSPSVKSVQVERIEFGSWTQKAYMHQDYGAEGPAGMWFGVDNFTVFKQSSPKGAKFSWSAQDANGIAGYSYLVDRAPKTIPPDKTENTTSTSFKPTEPGMGYLHVRALDKCGNWGRTNHYPVLWDDQPPQAGKLAVEDAPGRQVLHIPLQDPGVGLDSSSLSVQVGDRRFTWGSKALEYDREKGILTVDPWLDKLGYVPADGEKVNVLLTATDLIGQGFQDKPLGEYEAKSPLRVMPVKADGNNGFYVNAPKLSYEPIAGEKAFLQWQIDFAEDEFGRKGQSLNRLLLTLRYPDGQTRSLAKDFKLDTTTPATKVLLEEKPFAGGNTPQGARIQLRHDDYALAGGGLEGSYFTSSDFTGLILQTETANLDYNAGMFATGKKVFAATWAGSLRAPTAGEYRIRIRDIDPFSGLELYVDGELITKKELRDVQEDWEKPVFLTKGWHRLRIAYVPQTPMYRPLVFLWDPPETRSYEIIPVENLASVRNLAGTHYRWDEGKWELYSAPLTPPQGSHKLSFYSENLAGHKEATTTIEVNVK